MVLNSI